VLSYILEGLDGPEIAVRTHRSYNTVRNHLSRLRNLFGVSTTPELIIACHHRGIVARSARILDAWCGPATAPQKVRRRPPPRGRAAG
jgi:hypothetical protein